MPALLPLFPANALPAPFTHFDAATTLPDFAERVRHLRRWQQAIASGYVRSRKLTLPEKAEWLPYLEQHQQQQPRRAALQRQDAALDQLVYQLYQLTPQKIALVEGTAAPEAAPAP